MAIILQFLQKEYVIMKLNTWGNDFNQSYVFDVFAECWLVVRQGWTVTGVYGFMKIALFLFEDGRHWAYMLQKHIYHNLNQ